MDPGRARAFREHGLHRRHGRGLEQIHVPVCPTRTANLDPVVEAFEGLRLRTPRDHTSGVDWLLNFDHERLGHQLRVFLGPRPT
jgi:hypothetical protein